MLQTERTIKDNEQKLGLPATFLLHPCSQWP